MMPTRRFHVFSGEELIGYSDLEGQDPSMGVALGRFVPSEAYKKVAPVFRMWARATASTPPHDEALLAEYYRQRDLLRLSVRASSGEVVNAVRVHIADYSEDLGDEGLEITAWVSQWPDFERLLRPPAQT
jgi:hypothetical protein